MKMDVWIGRNRNLFIGEDDEQYIRRPNLALRRRRRSRRTKSGASEIFLASSNDGLWERNAGGVEPAYALGFLFFKDSVRPCWGRTPAFEAGVRPFLSSRRTISFYI